MSDKKFKILIAEDEKLLSKALNIKLTKAGFDITETHNGEEALKQTQTNTFDLILIDLVMPQFDGFHFLAEFKKNGLKTPVIVLSNLGQEEDIKKAKELGAVDFFIKSNTPLSKILELVNSKLNI
jgi:two-component system, OmpR family, response regulator ResD